MTSLNGVSFVMITGNCILALINFSNIEFCVLGVFLNEKTKQIVEALILKRISV